MTTQELIFDCSKPATLAAAASIFGNELQSACSGEFGRILGRADRESLARIMFLAATGRIDGHGWTLEWTTANRTVNCKASA